nr:cytochrome P450 89A9-like [Nicotiana tomentosiformis]
MTNTSTGIMESLFIIVVTFCISFFLILLFNLFFQKTKKLPPGPFIFPVIGMLPLLRKTSRDLELMLRDLKRKYGPIIAIKIGYSSPSIVISSHLLAYQALVQQGAICSDRPIASTTSKIFNSNQRTIASSSYGPTWRLLRRNLISEMLHPSRIICIYIIAPKPGVDHHHKEEEELEADIAYVDTLVNLELPEEKRKLNYQEMASLCGEFLAAASDTTYTALQWIMACLVKYPSIQEKLYKEICQVVESTPLLQSIKNNKVIEEAVKEEDLQKMPYLKAVILEGCHLKRIQIL